MLRSARAVVLSDSEAFDHAARILEHVGQVLSDKVDFGFGKYKDAICALADASSPIHDARTEVLFETVRIARNDAVHSGAFIRHHATRLVELILILEEAIMSSGSEAQDVMVQNPTTAELWHNIATIRRAMLANAFSYLPVRDQEGNWCIVSDYAVARFLKQASNTSERNDRLGRRLGDVVTSGDIKLIVCERFQRTEKIETFVEYTEYGPVLVVEGQQGETLLVGIVTASDLL